MARNRDADGALARAVGVTAPTVLRWCREGLLPDQPRRIGSGNPRDYTVRDYQVARALSLLTAALDTWRTGGIRQQVGEAVRDAVLDHRDTVDVEIGPGVIINVKWRQRVDLPEGEIVLELHGEQEDHG